MYLLRRRPAPDDLFKSQISAYHPGYVLRMVNDVNGHQVHRWVRVGSAQAGPTEGSITREQAKVAMAAAMRRVSQPRFPETSESNLGCTRRVNQLRLMAERGDYDGIANFSTSRTRTNYQRVDDYKQALRAAGQSAVANHQPELILGSAPVPPTLTASNMQNSALLSAQRKIHLLHAAATSAPDPVQALLSIQTTRSNGYTTAADNYRAALLRHFGYNIAGQPIPGHQAEGAPTLPADQITDIRHLANDTGLQPARSASAAPPRAPRAPRAPVSRLPVNPVPHSANPLNLTEAQLGFVPRPNVPLDGTTVTREGTRSNDRVTPWPNPEVHRLANRYLDQPTTLQTQARNYQAGTWVPNTPETQRARQNVQTADMVRIRREAARLMAKLEREDTFKAKAEIGKNIRRTEVVDTLTDTAVHSVMGVDKETALQMAKTMIADFGGTTKFGIKMAASGHDSIYVSFAGDDGTSISRYFTKTNDKLVVSHSYFSAGDTGNGGAKGLFRASFGVYKALGVSHVDVSANCDVGGYTWARFGFLPKNWSNIKEGIKDRLDELKRAPRDVRAGNRTTHVNQISAQMHSHISRILASNDPKTMWDIADMKNGGQELGKGLLLGTHWSGRLDLSDAATMRRLKKYVAEKRVAA